MKRTAKEAAAVELTQFDYKMYQDEIESIADRMTQILVEMEQKHEALTPEEFDSWWEGGAMRRYFDLKARREKLEQMLSYAQILQAPRAKMRKRPDFIQTTGKNEEDSL